MINIILDTCKKVHKQRDIADVFTSLIEEVGELSTEIAIERGHSHKLPGEDGIIGEAVDVVLCAIDEMYIHKPNITEDEISNIIRKKCNKWILNIQDKNY